MQTILTLVIVLCAIALAIYWIVKRLNSKGKNKNSDCEDCPLLNNCKKQECPPEKKPLKKECCK